MTRAQQPAAHKGPLYDRVDPTEFQSVEDEIESLKGERSAWETEQATHTSPSTDGVGNPHPVLQSSTCQWDGSARSNQVKLCQ